MSSSEEPDYVLAFCLTLGAGLATSIGALLPFFINVANKRILAISLGLSAGVMLYVSFIEIFYKSKAAFVDQSGTKHATLFTASCFFGGIIFAGFLNYLVHKIDPNHDSHDDPLLALEDPLQEASEEISPLTGDQNQDKLPLKRKLSTRSATRVSFLESPLTWIRQDWHGYETQEKDRKLKMTGFITALAIAIHNFPEGLATFVGTLADPSVGIALAVAIAIHNIPEGICVAIPIYYATGSRIRSFLWAFLSGLSEPLGAAIGWAIISIANNDIMFGIMFGIVGGMMVYISIAELLPTAHRYDPQDRFATAACVVGMMVMAASLLLFEY